MAENWMPSPWQESVRAKKLFLHDDMRTAHYDAVRAYEKWKGSHFTIEK